jgi:hypothetical protein
MPFTTAQAVEISTVPTGRVTPAMPTQNSGEGTTPVSSLNAHPLHLLLRAGGCPVWEQALARVQMGSTLRPSVCRHGVVG